MATKTSTRTYLISKASVRAALLVTLAPLPAVLTVKSFDVSTGVVLSGTLSAQPSIYIDTIDVSVTKAEIASFVNSQAGTAFTANQVLGVDEATDGTFYAVTFG